MLAKRKASILFGVSMLVATSGCATNALRVEYATDVAQKGTLAVAASREYLSSVERARYAADSDIIAADPACWQAGAAIRTAPDLSSVTDPRNPPRGWLCGTGAHALRLGPINAELAPTLLLIRSLAAYSAAITKILGTPGADPTTDLNNALTTARSAEGLLNALRGSSTTLVPAANDARLGAVRNLIGFLADLQNEADKAHQLARLRQGGAGGTAVIDAMIDHLENWEQSRVATEGFGIQLADTLLSRAVVPGSPLNAAQRRAYAEDYYARVRAQTSSAQLHDALRVLLDGLKQAEGDYQELLNDQPRLNDEMRARRAEIIRQRLTRAFDIATAIVTSFIGA